MTRVVVWLAVAILATPGTAKAVSYDMVSVGSYLIGKFEVTIGQYREFLTAVASATDRYGLYNPSMGTDLNVAGIKRSGSPGNYTYDLIGPSGITPPGAQSPGNRPISYVSWFDAARFANWMSNGQGTGSTESGAYALVNDIVSGSAPERNPAATFFIPTIQEWSKAAYESTTSGTWTYATQSNTAPGNRIGSEPNQANTAINRYSVTQSIAYSENQNYLTEVGAFSAGSSFYGTFDQNGNVAEWTNGPGSSIRALGGSWIDDSPSALTRAGGVMLATAYEGPETGFRLGGLAISPPPPPPRTEIVIHVPAGQTVRQSQSEFKKPALDVALPVRKTGEGTFIFDQANTLSGSLTIEAGAGQLSNPLAVSQSLVVPLAGGTLSIAAGLHVTVGGLVPSAGGVVDVGFGKMTVPGLLVDAARAAIPSGRIRPSPAIPESRRSCGWIDNGEGSVTIGYAAPGDTDLDWRVDIVDVANFVSGGKFDSGATAVWSDGDFNYDGTFDTLDASLFLSAALYDAGSYNEPSGSITAVPEPTSLGAVSAVLGLAVFATRWRRRARR